MESNLRDFASDTFGDPSISDALARSAIKKIADHVRDHQQDCLNAFFYDTDIASTPPSCDAQNNGVSYDAMLESGQWVFDPDGSVTSVQVSVDTANWTGIHPTEETPDQCNSSDENDGVLEDLELRSAGATQVGTPNDTVTIDDFRVRLWDRTPALLDEDGHTMTIPPGGAWFAISAAAEGAIGVVAATNETPIAVIRDGDEWTTSGFTIAYQDGFGEHWVLAILPAQWQ
jgi:hypothetical protein